MMRLANIIGIVDGIIVVVGMLVFGVRTALYSIVAVFVTSKVMDGVTSGMRYAKLCISFPTSRQKLQKLFCTNLSAG